MANTIINSSGLKAYINEQEQQVAHHYSALLNSFEAAMESIQPANLIRSTITEIAEEAPVPETAAGMAIAAGAGLITKKIIAGSSKSLVRSLLGRGMQLLVTAGLAKKYDALGRVGKRVLQQIIQ